MTRRATIKDVAARAGVSPATVSHAYSRKRSIADETRQRIFAAADELGYAPDPHARSMRTRRSGMVGLVLRPQNAVLGSPDSAETFNRLTGAIATHCLRRGVGLVHIPVGGASPTPALPMDGCIVAHPNAGDRVLVELRQRALPVVCIDPDPEASETEWLVEVDYLGAMRELAARVRAGGARRVLMLPGVQDNTWNRAARTVGDEWAEGEVTVLPLQEAADHTEVAGVLDAALAESGADAICVSDSSLTDAVLACLDQAGRRVPEDVQVAAFTDTVHTRRADVSAMDLQHEQSARLAVDLLLARIAGEPDPGTLVVQPRVELRHSTR